MNTRERVARAIADAASLGTMDAYWTEWLTEADEAIAAMLKTKAPKPPDDFHT